MPKNPDAEQYEDEILGSTARARTWLVYDETSGKDVIPGKFEPYDQIPPELVESVISLESSFNPFTVSSAGAIGLGQLVPSGQEISWYEQLMDDDITTSDLYDPQTNINLTAFGLGARWSELKDITNNKNENWYLAGARYFGCSVDESGNLGSESDAYGTNCSQYVDTLRNYVEEWYGEDAAEELGNVPGIDVTTRARGTVNDVQDVVNYLTKSLPTIALIGAGVIVAVLGLTIVMRA